MKNIVLITGYSLLTAFFLCTPPLCAQEKVLDRMTRSEARQETLRHTEIKDHVTFYHSNDKDIYVVYDLISSGNKEKMLQGKTILLGILDAFESTRNQSRPRAACARLRSVRLRSSCRGLCRLRHRAAYLLSPLPCARCSQRGCADNIPDRRA